MVFAEFAHAAQVVTQHVAVARSEAIVANHAPQGVDHVVQLPFVVAMADQFVLQFVQFLERPRQTVLIGSERESHGADMFDVLANVLEEALAPIVTAIEVVVIAVVGIEVATPVPVLIAVAVLIAATVLIAAPVKVAISIRTAWKCAAPHQVELVLVSASLRILNSHHNRSAAAGIANQLLAATAVDALKAKISGIWGDWTGALEPAPLRRLSTEIPQNGVIAAYLDFGDAVNNHLNGAFSLTGSAAADVCSALEGLSAQRADQCSGSSES